MAKETTPAATEETAQGKLHFTDDELLSIKSEGDALALLQDAGYTLEEADEVIGNGFAILPTEMKSRLEGVPLIFFSWKFNEGEQGEFVSALVLAQTQGGSVEKWILNDGSTGIKEQLKAFSKAKNRFGGLRVRRGLRRSDYTYTDSDGKQKPATTYYLDTSK